MAERSETSAADSNVAQSGAVSVDIYDQIYTLRGSNAAYIERLAELVDAKMRAVSSCGGTVDSLRVAVLAALNIADELVTLRARYDQLAEAHNQADRRIQSLADEAMRHRADSLGEMLDELIEDRRVG